MSNDLTGSDPFDRLRSLSWTLYIVSLLLMVVPLVDLVLNFLPMAPDQVSWRYGTVGMLSGFVLTPLIGATLATVTAHALEQRLMMRGMSGLNLVVALLLLGLTVMFVLDAIQMRSSITPERIRVFDIGVVRAVAKNGLTAVAFALMGGAGIRALGRLGTPHPDWIPRIIVPPELEAAAAANEALWTRGEAEAPLVRQVSVGKPAETTAAANTESIHGSAVAGTLSATAMTTDLPVPAEGGYEGRTIVWYTGALAGQTATVATYQPESSALTFAEMSGSPAEGDRFVIVAG